MIVHESLKQRLGSLFSRLIHMVVHESLITGPLSELKSWNKQRPESLCVDQFVFFL